jgi:hypothetical protein
MGMVRGNRRKILNGIFSFRSGFIFKDGGGLRVSEQTVSFSPLQRVKFFFYLTLQE